MRAEVQWECSIDVIEKTMTLYSILFYILALVILASTAVAITRRDMVHAVIYLVVSFFGSALLFYLMGAPLLAALEIIIYAGAIMVLFLFIVMMIRVQPSIDSLLSRSQLVPAVATPSMLGQYVFQQHWVTVEIASLLLLVALVGAMIIGGSPTSGSPPEAEEES